MSTALRRKSEEGGEGKGRDGEERGGEGEGKGRGGEGRGGESEVENVTSPGYTTTDRYRNSYFIWSVMFSSNKP